MRSIAISTIAGILISTALMAIIYGWALIGHGQALNALLQLTMPSFNLAAQVLGPTAPDDLDGGVKMLYVLFLSAWLQIAVIAAVVVAGIRFLSAPRAR